MRKRTHPTPWIWKEKPVVVRCWRYGEANASKREEGSLSRLESLRGGRLGAELYRVMAPRIRMTREKSMTLMAMLQVLQQLQHLLGKSQS